MSEQPSLFEIAEATRSKCLYPERSGVGAYQKGCRCGWCVGLQRNVKRQYYRRVCLTDGCLKGSARGSMYCADHWERRKCAADGCLTVAPPKKRFCVAHAKASRFSVRCVICLHSDRVFRRAPTRQWWCPFCETLVGGRFRARALRHRVPVEMIRRMVHEQKCWLCCKPIDLRAPNGYTIDHDHRCCPGQIGCEACVRGLLCPSCNSNVGGVEALIVKGCLVRSLEYIESRYDPSWFPDEEAA